MTTTQTTPTIRQACTYCGDDYALPLDSDPTRTCPHCGAKAAAHDVPIHVGGVELRLQDAAMIRATLKRRLRRIANNRSGEWDLEAIYSIARVLDLAEPDWRATMPNVAARLRNAKLRWYGGGLVGESASTREVA